MKKSIIFFALTCCLFSACNPGAAPESITGAQLKGEWLLFLNDKQLISYEFSGDARVSRTFITPTGYCNAYREGYYDIDQNNIVIFINEYDSINDVMEYTRSCDWRYVSLQDSVLTVVDKDVQLSLCKVLHEINIDLSKNNKVELSELFDESEISDIKVFDKECVHVMKSKRRLTGLAHGTTYVQVSLTNGQTIIIKVNVISKDLDAFIAMHKIIGCPLDLIDNYWGEPDYELSDDQTYEPAYIVNNCYAYVISMDNTLLVDAVTIMYGDFLSGDIYTDEYVQQYMAERYTFVGELDGEWYYLIDDYSPDELLIAINPEGDYMYIY